MPRYFLEFMLRRRRVVAAVVVVSFTFRLFSNFVFLFSSLGRRVRISFEMQRAARV